MAPVIFRGIEMKISLKETGALGILRCTEDGKTLLVFHDDDITLQDCEHYHWHLGHDEDDEGEFNKKDERGEDEEDGEEEDWNEVLKANHIAAVSVEGGTFYLVRLENAVKEG